MKADKDNTADVGLLVWPVVWLDAGGHDGADEKDGGEEAVGHPVVHLPVQPLPEHRAEDAEHLGGGWIEVWANRYTRLENLVWSHAVFIQFSFSRKHRFMKPWLLSSIKNYNSFNPLRP